MVPGQDKCGGNKTWRGGSSSNCFSVLPPGSALPLTRQRVLPVEAQTQQTRWRITAHMCLESLPEQKINMPKITPPPPAGLKQPKSANQTLPAGAARARSGAGRGWGQGSAPLLEGNLLCAGESCRALMGYVGSWEGAHHSSTERDFPSKCSGFDFPGEPKARQEFGVCACTARGLQIFCSQLLQWTPDTAFILLSVFFFFL